MEKLLIFGHRNPDTDTICSAIVYANMKVKLGIPAEPVRLGGINGETQFALEYFQVQAPRLIETAANEASHVILVDHNERQQSVSDIEKVRVLEVIDHHRVANFETSEPLYYRAEPVGCTTTIIKKLYAENGVAISKEMAGLMLSAIISDTILFKSPTCTEEDVAAAGELAAIAEVDAATYGMAMLKAGAQIADKTINELLSIDAKEFPIGSHKVLIAQINVVDPQEIFDRQQELESAISAIVSEKGLDVFILAVTDILNCQSTALVLGHFASAVEQAFHVTLQDNKAVLKGVVSRKKQIVPVLTDMLNKL